MVRSDDLEQDRFDDLLRKITVRVQEEWFEFVFELEPTWADGRVQQLSEFERDKLEDLLRKITVRGVWFDLNLSQLGQVGGCSS